VLVRGVDEVERGVDDVGVDDGPVVLLLVLREPKHVQDLHLLAERRLARLLPVFLFVTRVSKFYYFKIS
jgi:hypothetical protein